MKSASEFDFQYDIRYKNISFIYIQVYSPDLKYDIYYIF